MKHCNTILLSAEEADVLRQHSGVRLELLRRLTPSSSDGRTVYVLEVTDDEALEIYELCTVTLQRLGLDESYELTSEGRVLMDLIEKFG
jgi:hypothetical protein